MEASLMNDFISVVIPTFCRSIGMLNDAVQSVKGQKLPVDEIIIVDDNIDNALSRNIALYCHQNNLIYVASGNVGAAIARNIGINIAKGAYVAFLDDDDIWLSDKLLMQLPLFSDPNVGLVYSRGYTIKIDSHGHTFKTPYATDSYYKTEVYYKDLLEKNYIGTTSQLVARKSVLMHINGFDESLPSRQDYDLCLRVARHYRCLGVDDYLFIHYIHSEDQITAHANINMIGYKFVFKKYKSDIYQIKDAPRMWCYRIMRCALADSSYPIFIRYLFLAIISNPFKIKETIKKCIKQNK